MIAVSGLMIGGLYWSGYKSGLAMGIALAQMLDGSPYPFYQYHMDNTGLSKLSYTDRLEIIDFNVVDHLQGEYGHE